MHFGHQRLIFSATGHSHIDNWSSIMLEMESRWQQTVFSLTTLWRGQSHISSCHDEKSAALQSTLISITGPVEDCFAWPRPSQGIWSDGRILCSTWVNKQKSSGGIFHSYSCWHPFVRHLQLFIQKTWNKTGNNKTFRLSTVLTGGAGWSRRSPSDSESCLSLRKSTPHTSTLSIQRRVSIETTVKTQYLVVSMQCA